MAGATTAIYLPGAWCKGTADYLLQFTESLAHADGT